MVCGGRKTDFVADHGTSAEYTHLLVHMVTSARKGQRPTVITWEVNRPSYVYVLSTPCVQRPLPGVSAKDKANGTTVEVSPIDHMRETKKQ